MQPLVRRLLVGLPIAGVAIALAIAATRAGDDPGPAHVPDLAVPTPAGHGIGRAALQWTDASRELRGWMYYPAADAPAVAGPALDAGWAQAYRPSLERRIGAAAADAMLRAKWHAVADAPAATGRFPVLVFAHGNHQLPSNYNAVLEGLVSRGYVVLAIASPGIAEVAPQAGGRIASNTTLDDDSYDTMARDIASAVVRLPSLDAAAGQPFAGHLDLGRVGVFGHSIGGAAAVLASARVPSIRAAANLDGDYGGASAVEQPRVPLLYITSQPPNRPAQPKSEWDDERNEVRRAGIWRRVGGRSPQAIRIRVGGMFHSNFQDEALLPAYAIPERKRGSRFGSIDGARGLELITRLLAGFFAAALDGPSAEGLQETVAKFPEADLRM